LPYTIPDACVELAASTCARMRTCAFAAFERSAGNADDMAACLGVYATTCARAMTAPGSGLSPAKAIACASHVTARACRRWRMLDDFPDGDCHPTGKLALGARCIESAQCASGFCYARSSENAPWVPVCGTCAPMANMSSNTTKSCSDMSYDGGGRPDVVGCPPGAKCSRSMCIGPFADEGERCGTGAWYDTCYAGSYPSPFNVSSNVDCNLTTMRCERNPAQTPCEEDGCYFGEFCSPTSKTCQPMPVTSAAPNCDGDSACAGGARCLARHCVRVPRLGDPCDEAAGTWCSYPLSCWKGRCALVDQATCEGP
jgi:hypothetical protein